MRKPSAGFEQDVAVALVLMHAPHMPSDRLRLALATFKTDERPDASTNEMVLVRGALRETRESKTTATDRQAMAPTASARERSAMINEMRASLSANTDSGPAGGDEERISETQMRQAGASA